jgi:hypothetical protein
MQLLFYASENYENEKRLDAAIRSVAPGGTIERFVKLKDFRNRLRSIVEPNSIMVLAAVDREELLEMQAYRDMLTEIFIILVLPDRQESTIKLAHLLRPRFLSQVNDDFSELNQIIAKMIQTHHGPPETPVAAGKPIGNSGSLP